jgi:sugar phosphate isomerase/epimerase
MKLGISGMLPEWQQITPAITKRVREAGFLGAQWFFTKPLETDLAAVRQVQDAFKQAGLKIAQVNGWYESLVNTDENLRKEGIRGYQSLLRLGAIVEAPSVYMRPGSMNPKGHWFPHPKNIAPETFDQLIDSVGQCCRVAEEEGMLIAIEGHVVSPLDTSQRVRQLINAVGSPALKFNADPVNFIGTVPDLYDTNDILNEMFDLLGKDTIVSHAKDVAIQDAHVVHIIEVLIGTGTLNYEIFLRRFQECAPNGWIQIEHLPDEKVPAARHALVEIAEQLGIPLEY